MAESQSKNKNEGIFFKEILINIRLNLLRKDVVFPQCPEAKLKEPTLNKCKQLSDEKVARTLRWI